MNILIYRYNSIYEPDVIDVLKQLGHRVDELTQEMERKDIAPQECLKWVSNALKKKKYDLVFSINFFPVISEVCNIFQVPYFCWIVDSPVMEFVSPLPAYTRP